MPEFPRREDAVLGLALAIHAGFTQNPTVFPSANPVGLQALIDAYNAAKELQEQRLAQALLATQQKDTALVTLTDFMKVQLKQSEVDVAANLEQLELIGWGKKAAPQPSDPPGAPRSLEADIQGSGIVHLDWKTPGRGTGGTVRTYLIERREEPQAGGEFSEWHQAGIALETQILLRDQPRKVQMEYRVIGVNTGGNGEPSASVPVVL